MHYPSLSSSYDYSSQEIDQASYRPIETRADSCITKVCSAVAIVFMAAIFMGIKAGVFGLMCGFLGSIAMGATTDAAIKAAMVAGVRLGLMAGFFGTFAVCGLTALCCPRALN